MGLSELEQYLQQFEQVKIRARALTEGLNEVQFNWRPAPIQWSIEECLAHLVITGNWELREVERAVDDGRSRGLTGSGPFRYGGIDRFILGMTEPPVRRKVRSPRRFVPLHEQPVTAIVPSFLHLQDQFMEQVRRSEGLDLKRIKVVTPISRLIRMSLGMTFAQALAHERRHLGQAEAVRQQVPASLSSPTASPRGR